MASIPVISNQIFFRKSATESIVLVDLAEDEFFWQIDGLAADLWQEIDGVKTWQEIKNLHCNRCELEPAQFEIEADNFLNELIKFKIVSLI